MRAGACALPAGVVRLPGNWPKNWPENWDETAMNPLKPQRYLHTIHAATACERLRHIYCDTFGGIVFSENYFAPQDRDAALLYVADHMIEVMAPRDPADESFMFARYVRKAGQGYHSISFKVADCAAGHRRCDELGIAINTTGPGLIFLHPRSTGGFIVELTDNRMPNDPWDLPHWRRDWAEGRPDRPHRLAHVVCAPRAPAAAVGFLVDVLEGEVVETTRLEWPQPATATRVRVSDIDLVVLTPDAAASGPLVDFARGPNCGVYALAWEVASSDATVDWFTRKQLPLTALAPGLPYRHELMLDGARHWFV